MSSASDSLTRRRVVVAVVALTMTACSSSTGARDAGTGTDASTGDDTAEFELDTFNFAVDPATTVTTLADGRALMQGSVTVPSANGGIELADADLAIGVDGNGEPTIAGTARVPFPIDGVLADAQIKKLPVGQVGSAYGRDLTHLGAHLQDNRRYLYFAFDGGLEVDLPFAGMAGYEALPAKVEVPAGQSAVFVLDPSDPYFYVGTNCPDVEFPDNKKSKKDSDDDASTPRTTQPDNDEPEVPSSAYYTLEPTNLDLGQECGIGFSFRGNIPAPSTAGTATFTGHVVVDGVVPLYAGIDLDGSAVVSLESGAHTAAWGDVLATVPLIESLLDIKIPLGQAAVDIQAETTRIGVAYSGSIGGQDPTYELPFVGIPITIPASGKAIWDAQLGFVNSGGSWTIDDASYIALTGEMGVGFSDLGDLLGIDLTDGIAQGSLRIDRTGARLEGRMSAQIHAAIAGGDVAFELTIAPTDWHRTRLGFTAGIEVAGQPIADAGVVLDGTGLRVSGVLDLGAVKVDIAGRATTAGLDLVGSADIELRLDGVAEAARSASQALDAVIAEVQRLDGAIAAAREQVRAERRSRDAGFIAAQEALAQAIRDLDQIDANVRLNNLRIAELQGLIDDENNWYVALLPLAQVWELAGHTARLAGWNAEIAALTTANIAQRDIYRPAAVATLNTAQAFLSFVQSALDALPVDLDPRVATLLTARIAAVGALELAQSGVELFEIEGSLRGAIDLRVGTSGVGGEFRGQACGQHGCTTLAAGRLLIGNPTEVCVELPALGEQCLKL